jgi:hypothetical protein
MKILGSESAVAEVVGNIIIMAITITGIGMITLVGVPAIQKMEDMATVRNVEQTYTFLDSRASGTITGDSPVQTIDMDMGGGTIRAEPNGSGVDNKSYLTVRSTNSTINITIPMGAVKYRLGERTIAYEGGGVFSKYPSGASVMLSPPEFHFNGETLTLPVMTVNNAASIGGDGNAQISFKKVSTQVLFPNAGVPNRTNPVLAETNEKLYVNITSDYYDGWADYAKTIAYTSVSKNPGSKTISLELEVSPPMGTFPFANKIKIRNINTSDPNPFNDFSLNLFSTTEPTSETKVDYEVKNSSGYMFTIEFHRTGNGNKNVGFDVKYYGKDKNVDEAWSTTYTDPSYPMYVDFLNNSVNLTYSKTGCATWSPPTCTKTTQESLNDIIQHYIHLMGSDMTITVDQQNHVDYGRSTYTINYDVGSGTFILYMHIAQNNVDVTLS